VSVVCCQLEVCATSWSLVQRSTTDLLCRLCMFKKIPVNEEAIAREIGLQRQQKKSSLRPLLC